MITEPSLARLSWECSLTGLEGWSVSSTEKNKVVNRRKFLLSGVATGAAIGLGNKIAEAAAPTAATKAAKPNIILYMSDQFRWDFLGATGLNGSTKTPNGTCAPPRRRPVAIPGWPNCAPCPRPCARRRWRR